MEFSRDILMGDPAFFSIRRGANPHTRNRWGIKKKVDRGRAREQWTRMTEILREYGVRIHVIPPHPDLPGLVFPANGGVVRDPERPLPLNRRRYLLANLSPARTAEEEIYRELIQGLGLKVERIRSQFEGEADLIPWGKGWIFTYGNLETPRWVPRWGIPPWRRVYGFRSARDALAELKAAWTTPWLLDLELSQEPFYHGDTVLTSFGPAREYLMVYGPGLKGEGLAKLRGDPHILWIPQKDARYFAANSFQILHQGQPVLFMPEGVSAALRSAIEAKGVETLTIDVSEFYDKGGGSVKCLIGDLGAWGNP